jgi:hypothetical protein
MHGLNLLAVKAAALRKHANGDMPGLGVPWGGMPEKPLPRAPLDPAMFGVRAGEQGLGVPSYNQGTPGLAALSAADQAALASPEAAAASRYAGKPTVPVMGRSGKGSVLLRMMKSRGGKAGLGLTAAGGAGYGLFGKTMDADADPVPEAPADAPANPRLAARQSVAGKAGKALGSWWDRMSDKYNLGSRGQR